MELLNALLNVVESVGLLIWQLVQTIAPWTPLIAWVAFWTLAVDWVKLRGSLLKGGLIGVILLGLVMVLIWGVVAPPETGSHYLLGLKVSNFVGKTVYVTALFVIMFLCGSVQLSGCCDRWLCLENPLDVDHDGDDAHGGHGGHDAHGH
ncbi:MAG: hypothetical protein R3C01_15790 [Planctomycetaceae bacterium]